MTLSPERLGRFTASSIYKLVVGGKTRETYIFEKAVESIKGHAKGFSNKYTEHGHLNEYEAIETFRKLTGKEIVYLEQKYFAINENFGATPDAAEEDFNNKFLASCDVKCPPETFFAQKMALIKESKPEYQNVTKEFFFQAQAQMMALNVDRHLLVWYLTSMDTTFEGDKVEYNIPLETRLFYTEIKADPKVQDMLLKEVEQAAKERDLIIEILRKPILKHG